MNPGEKFGIMLVPNGEIEALLNNSKLPANKQSLFSVATDLPEDNFWSGQIASFETESEIYTWEDLSINGDAEITIPVLVEPPETDSNLVDESGGVVETEDGSVIMVPTGALTQETSVGLTPLTREDLSLSLPESLEFVGAFELELGDTPLEQPVQLAIPAPADLEAGKISVGTPGVSDIPGELAATGNGTRAYVPLEDSGQVALVDLMALRQVDADAETPEVEPIPLPEGATPVAVVVDSDDEYAYVADSNDGKVYVLDVNPESDSYHEVVKTIALELNNDSAELRDADRSDTLRVFMKGTEPGDDWQSLGEVDS